MRNRKRRRKNTKIMTLNDEVDDITNLRRNKRKIIKIMEKRKIKT